MDYLLLYVCFQLTIISLLFIAVLWKVFGNDNVIDISVRQEFSAEDRQLLEDLYNEKGELKSKESGVIDALDDVVRNINNIMLDTEDNTNE